MARMRTDAHGGSGGGNVAARPACLPEVEPLGDVRWARIEQSLMARLDEMPSLVATGANARDVNAAPRSLPGRSRARGWPVALVATFAVSAAAAVSLYVTRPHLSASTSRFVTEASASHVTIAESSLDVSPESGIEIREDEHATVLTLERGEVALHVAPREKDRPFLVEAGDVHVRVVGTEFTVRRVGIGATVAVRRGTVEVREHGELALLHAGDHWPSETKSEALGMVAGPTPIANPNPNPIAASTPTSTSTPAPTPTPTPAPIAAAPPRPRHSRPAAAPRLASPQSQPPPEPQAPPQSPPPPAPQAQTQIQPQPVAAPPVPPQDPLPLPDATPQSRYESAAQLERTDPSRALRVYLDLARGADLWSQNALYAAGRLQADRGARTDAARLLEEYLRRFPRGSNAQDARALRESLR